MNSIGSVVRQILRMLNKDMESLRLRPLRLTPSFLAGILLFVVIFAGLSSFISRDRIQLVRVKLFSYALISLEKVNDLLAMEEIRPSPNSFIFKGSYRKGLLAQGSAALSVMQANRSLLLPLEDRDLQSVLLSYALLEKGIRLHWRETELFDVNRRIVPRLTALSFAVSQKRDLLTQRLDRMLFLRMGLLLLSSVGVLVFLLAQWARNGRVSRQNRFYRSLSRIDRLILSLPDPESLFRSTCRILMDESHVRAVWIGRYDPDHRTGRWVAYDGKITQELIRRPLSVDPDSPGGQGIWAHTIRNRGVVVWNDPLSSLPEGSLRDLYRANGIRSAAGFPLVAGETLYGALIVQSDEPDYFDPDLAALIAFLVENMSFSLENWEREEARKHYESRVQSLLEWMENLTRETELPALLSGSLETICQFANSDNGAIVLWNPSLRAFSYQAFFSLDPQISTDSLLEKTLLAGEGVAGKILETGKPLLIEDYQTFSGAIPEFRALGLKGEISVPVKSRQRTTGALVVGTFGQKNLDPDDLPFLEVMGRQLGAVLDHIQRTEHQAILRETIRKISLEKTLDGLIEQALEAFCRMTGADYGGVCLPDGTTGLFFRRTLFRALPDFPDPFEGDPGRESCPLLARLAESGKSLRIDDIPGQAEFLPELSALGAKDLMAVPFLEFGALWLASTHPIFRFNPFDLSLLESLAQEIGMIQQRILSEEMRERYVRLFENVREGIVITDSNRSIIDVNPFFVQTTGYAREEVLGKNPRILHSGRQGQDFYRTMWETIDREGHWEGEIWNRKKSGEIYCEWISIESLKEDGRITNYLGIFSDITERKQSEKIQSQLGRILDESPSEIYTFDAESLTFVSANAGALKNLGYSPDELRQMTPLDIKPGFTRESFEKLLAALRRGEQEILDFQTEHRRKDGSLYPVEIRLQISRTASPPVFVAIVQDITERKQNERRIEHLATHDALTDLPNRRVYLDRIDQTFLRSGRTGERFAVGILDLDGFKEVNDRLGHPKGDELLIQVGKRMGDLLRKTDTLARLGGDEFGLLLTDLEEGAAYQDLFTKIVDSLLDPFDVEDGSGESVRISGSLGLALCPPDRGDAPGLIAHADLALYRVKDRGGNGWAIFESGMEESLLEQHRIRTEFGRALENGELCLHYQPQADMATGQVIGAEALVRWNHPERGFLIPASFIEVVEKSDLIALLGRWVLETAMAQQVAWEKEGLNLRLSVNIGARHFLSDGFVGDLEGILSGNGHPEHLVIEIEVTETEALRDLSKARQMVERCHMLGVSVSLDDFGTGQASLTSLQQLDIKEVKIDKGFVHRMLESQKDLAIVSSLSVAARMMMIDVVAEGVETEEEGEILIQMGCRTAQGYAIARPMPPSMIVEWAREWRPFESWRCRTSGKKGGFQDDTLLMVGQAVKVFLKGILTGLETPGAMKEEWTDSRRCVPGQWIERSGRSRYGGTPQFDSLERIHAAIHALAREALSARDRNDTEALERLKSELTETSLALREALQKLAD